MQNEDDVIVSKFKSGDKMALNMLVKKWHIIFCKKAYWIVKDANLAKDIAQESWQIIITKIDKLNEVSSFGSWAMRIVYTKSLDALREQSKERFHKQNLSKNPETEDLPYDENLELKSKLLKAIAELPEQQQTVIKLFYTQEYSLKDISIILKVSTGTVKSRLFHAREKLKTNLKNRTYEH